VAVIPVDGALAMGFWDACCGMCTPMPLLASALRHAVKDESVRGILIDCSCPGGTIAGSDDLMSAVREATAKKPVHLIAHDEASSLAVQMACLCTRFIATPTAQVGCIGSLVVVQDTSQNAQQNGVRPVVITQTPLKTTGLYGVPIGPEHEAVLRELDSAALGRYLAPIAAKTGKTDQELIGYAGRSWYGPEALAAGLIDEVSSFDAYLSKFAASLRPGVKPVPAATAAGKSTASAARKPAPVPTASSSARRDRPAAARTVSPAATRPGASMTIDQLKAMFPGLPEDQYQAMLDSYVAPNPDAAGDAATETTKTMPAASSAASPAAHSSAARPATYDELVEAIGIDTPAGRESVIQAQAQRLTLVAAVKAHASSLTSQLAEARKIAALPGGRQTPVSGGAPAAAAGSAASGWVAQFAGIPVKDRFMAMARKASAERGIPIDRAIKSMVAEFPAAHAEFKTANEFKRDLAAATRV
jgi:ClpP class serine protease